MPTATHTVRAGIVSVMRFCTGSSSVFSSYIDYISRDKATRNDAFHKYSLYQDYMDNPDKTTELFTADRDNLTQAQKRTLKNAFSLAQKNGSVLWQNVISFDNAWLEQNGLFDVQAHLVNEPKLQELTRGYMEQLLKAESLAGTAVWSAAIHYNTDNIHIHIAMAEPVPTRKRRENGEVSGKLKQSSLDGAKSYLVNHILDQRKENTQIQSLMRAAILADRKQFAQSSDSKFAEQFLKIFQQLPKDKRLWQYNRNALRNVRPEIDKLTQLFLDTYHKQDMEELTRLLQQRQAAYEIAYGLGKGNNAYAENKLQDLFARLGNVTLAELRAYAEGTVQEQFRLREQMELDPDSHPDSDQLDSLLELEAPEEMEQWTPPDLDEGETIPPPLEELPEGPPPDPAPPRAAYKSKARKEFEECLDRAQAGNIPAFFDLARRLQFGNGCEKNPAAAFKFMTHAAENGHVQAMHHLGRMLERGVGCAKNFKMAQLWYQEAAMQHNSAAMVSLAGLLRRGKEPNLQTAAMWYGIAADAGRADAQYELGRMLRRGEGVEQDEPTASKMLYAAFLGYSSQIEDACGLNLEHDLFENTADPLASSYPEVNKSTAFLMYRLGTMRRDGEGIPRDLNLSAQWLAAAAVNGHKNACSCLAKLYEAGQGVQQDRGRAAYLYEQAAGLGDAHAAYSLGRLYQKDGKHLEAAAWYTRACDSSQEIPHAAYELAKMAQKGLGIPKDEETAQFLFEKALRGYKNQEKRKPDPVRQYRIANMLQYGLGAKADPAQAAPWLKACAQAGHPDGLFQLAVLYERGDGVSKDPQKAQEYYKQALDGYLKQEKGASYASRAYRIGRMLLDGKGGAPDPDAAREWLQKAAEHSHSHAAYLLGKQSEKEDAAQAIHWYRQAAKDGDPLALHALGKLTGDKDSPGYDPAQAAESFELAAALGNPDSMVRLAGILERGDGRAKDPAQAAALYKKALQAFQKREQAHPDAMLERRIAQMIQTGKGCEKSLPNAIPWFHKAAEHGDRDAKTKLAKLTLKGDHTGLSKEQAGQLLESAANQGSQEAQYALGKKLLRGDGLPKDVQRGVEYLLSAAAQGSSYAQYWLGRYYLDGVETETDLVQAVSWFQKSAGQDNPYAQCQMGRLYLSGLGVEQDVEKALDLLNKAAEQDHSFALYRLGRLYWLGEQVPYDPNRAYEYFIKSAEQNNQFAQYSLGKMFLTGDGDFPRDANAAAEWFEKAADQGNSFAQYQLGRLFWMGDGVPRDRERAWKYFSQAAEAGNPFAANFVDRQLHPTEDAQKKSFSPSLHSSLHKLAQALNNEYEHRKNQIQFEELQRKQEKERGQETAEL